MRCFPSWGRVQVLQPWGESLSAVGVYSRWSWKTSVTHGFSSLRLGRGAESPTMLHCSPATVLELW